MEQKLFDAAARLPEANLAFEDIDKISKLPKIRTISRDFWTVVACLVLVLTVGISSAAIAAEAKEYQEALSFFDAYGLSTEGLTREEIKAIYRDITEEIFENPKTTTVITNQTQTIDGLNFGQIGGFEIVQEAPSAEEMGTLKDLNDGNWAATPLQGIRYTHSTVLESTGNGSSQQVRNYVEMYNGELLLWKVLLDGDWRVSGIFPLADGVLVTGEYCVDCIWINDYPLENYWCDWFIKLSTTGQVVFSKAIHDLNTDRHVLGNVVSVVGNSDGSFTAFCQGSTTNSYSLAVYQYNANGEKISNGYVNTVGLNGKVGAVSLWRNGYAVQVNPASKYNAPNVMLFNERGMPVRNITYNTPTEHFFFTDMMVANGKLYISAYTTPKKQVAEPREEIKGILDYLYENNISTISSAELTPIVRENYTAMLLVCNAETGIPETFYSVDGSLGGQLHCTEQGVLLWDVESITSTLYSPVTSSFTIGGTCAVYRYAFIGNTVSQQKTDQVTIYRR